eukprot:43504-Amphidinium_carterae.1
MRITVRTVWWHSALHLAGVPRLLVPHTCQAMALRRAVVTGQIIVARTARRRPWQREVPPALGLWVTV